mmetsp:Transcript_52560/g.138240  ORF Transcript_52560/g.138240 Transcript_52560/m.138240 type:complete len:85 (-) Transcript_52560:34-288(-)
MRSLASFGRSERRGVCARVQALDALGQQTEVLLAHQESKRQERLAMGIGTIRRASSTGSAAPSPRRQPGSEPATPAWSPPARAA